ncbi:MAG: hypothetical protein IPM98_21855 [Lewinellaceae bacterium]|nr:hypothetical protein [Lewinellaceae bacterium]
MVAQINTIRQAGRQPYRRQYSDDPDQRVFSFHYIEHEHIGSALINAFPRWQHKLDELLV